MSTEQLPSGAFRITISGGKIPGTGRYRRLRATLPAGSSKAELARAELALRMEAEDTTVDGDMMSTTALCRGWIDNGRTVRAEKTTLEYERLVRNWVAPFEVGGMACSRVRTPHVEAHYRDMLGKVGVSTVRHTHSVLRGAFRWATAMGWIASNPVSNTSPLPAQGRTVVATDPAVWAQAVEQADDIKAGLGALLLFVGTTGVRKGEALALRWCDIDDGRAHIGRALVDLPGGPRVKDDTKTHSERWVPVSERTGTALEHVRRGQIEASMGQPGVGFSEEGFVWSADGCGIVPWRADSAGKLAGRAGVKFGQLRHMVATELLASGVPVHEVSALLGHASVKMTLDVYGQAVGDRMPEMAATMERFAR